MYANPLEYVVCALIPIARYMITHTSIVTGQSNLSEGYSQYEPFNKIFNKVVQTHQYEFECLGISVIYYGTNSIRKGAFTSVFKVCTLSPSMASIFLHDNWT